MRTIPFLGVFLAVLLLASYPSSANDPRDYTEERLDEWIEHAENLGYEIIKAETGTMRSSRTYYLRLWPGVYHAYAEGGERIEDLNMAAFDSRGRELASDYMADNYPVVSFTLRDRQEITIELTAGENHHPSRDQYCFVLSREPGRFDGWERGRWSDEDYWSDREDEYWRDWEERGDDPYCRDFSWDAYWDNWGDEWRYRGDEDWSQSDRRRYVESRLDYLRDYARNRHMRPVMDDVRKIDNDETYTIMLSRGRYVLFAGAGPWIEDLDLHVSDGEGWTIADDIQLDDAPAVWFQLSHAARVEIEVEVWGFKGFHDEDYFCVLLCRD